MKAIAAATLLLFASPAAFAERQFVDNGKTFTVDCAKDAEISLVGNHLKVTLKGTCTRVNVLGNHETVTGTAATFFLAGNHNDLRADRADKITVAGSHNTVAYGRGLKKPRPQVTNTGRNNTIKKK